MSSYSLSSGITNSASGISNCMYVDTGSISTATAWTPYTVTNDSLDSLLMTLTEDEIDDIVQKMLERNRVAVTEFINSIIRLRHFSEDFLMTYIEHIEKSSILQKHRHEFTSGQYSRLRLYFEAKEFK